MEKKYCKICGKEITSPRHRKYCSKECYIESVRRKSRGGRILPPLKETVCPICHKKFKQHQRDQMFCSNECRAKGKYKLDFINHWIHKVADQFDFEVKNQKNIVKAKLLCFGEGNVRRCPCDASNPNRYCGSALCIHDTVHYGHCCCRLFWSKNKPIDEKSLQEWENRK